MLGIRHNSVDAIRRARRKDFSRKALKNSGLLVPSFWIVKVDENREFQLKNIEYPCVAKPVNLSASRGVIRANNLKELNNALDKIEAILRFVSTERHDQIILVERYIPGEEFALEGFMSDGQLETICIFDKPDPLEGPYFEETYYVTPSRLPKYIQKKAQNIVRSVCLHYDIRCGPVHAEFRINNSEVWLLEVAARTIGGDCGRLFELATNCSLEEYVLSRAYGIEVESIRLSQAAGVLMIPVPNTGIVRRIEGMSDAQEVDNILEVRLDARSGERLQQWPEGDKYPGFIFAKADTPEEVEHALRKAHSLLDIVIMPELPTKVASF